MLFLYSLERYRITEDVQTLPQRLTRLGVEYASPHSGINFCRRRSLLTASTFCEMNTVRILRLRSSPRAARLWAVWLRESVPKGKEQHIHLTKKKIEKKKPIRITRKEAYLARVCEKVIYEILLVNANAFFLKRRTEMHWEKECINLWDVRFNQGGEMLLKCNNAMRKEHQAGYRRVFSCSE